MNYPEAMEYLKNLTKFGINLGLGRIENLLERLGNPHQQLMTVHVGGTNGKGSTSAFLVACLREAGYRVGLFSSPHLERYTERMMINNEEIPEETLADLVTRLRPHLEAMVAEGYEQPTEFEVSTALALLYFCEAGVDLAVVEVGLGGAIDSTNVIRPLVSIITNVERDHMEYLGETVEEIARVKGGIIKPGVPVVTASRRGEVLAILEELAGRQGSKLFRIDRDFSWIPPSIPGDPWRGERGTVQLAGRVYGEFQLGLLGLHQRENAAVAVMALALLEGAGFPVGLETVSKGLAGSRWPGRLEVLRDKPRVLLDGAHNTAGAEALARFLEEAPRQGRLLLVIGMLGDKEREQVVRRLAPLADAIWVTRPNHPRATQWEELAGLARNHCPQVALEAEIDTALQKALEAALEMDLLVVTGSLYMVGEARSYLLTQI